MKMLSLLILFLFQLTFVFGQKRDEVGHRVTPWVIARHGCFNGLEWKVRKSYYSDNSDNFINEIEIKNKYLSKITFSFDVSADANAKTTQSRKTLNPEETTRFTRVQNVDFVYLYIADVCFNSDNKCAGTCYALCDNGTSNIPTDCGGQKSNANSNSTTQTNNSTQQNDLTEYNRSKADLERQIAEKNAEGQQKSQNYTAAMNAGISAHNSGNYDEAKRQFSIALNNCNTEEAKQKAQEYYNKTVNAEKSQSKIKAIGDLTNATVNLVSYFANRKNALRNSLSQEDAQALIDIVNSENPADYTQNIVQIFTDLGYTYRETEKMSNGMTAITMNNDINNINDFLNIFIHPASYNDYNTISFSYHRKEKLLQQLASLGSNLEGFKRPEIKGVPLSRREKVGAIFRKEESEKENKKKNVIEINKWVRDFNVTNSDIETSNNITAEEIINRSIEATGGLQKLKEVQNVIINEDYGDGYNHKIIIAYGKYAATTTYPTGKPYSKDVLVGKKGYHIFLGDRRKLLETEKQELGKKEPVNILSIQKLQLKLGKIQKFNDKGCYTLINEERATFGENLFNINTYFFDIKSGLLVGRTQHLNSKPNDNRYEVYDEYENIDGILFHTQEISFYESDKNTTTIIDGELKKNAFIIKRKIKLNENITDRDFE